MTTHCRVSHTCYVSGERLSLLYIYYSSARYVQCDVTEAGLCGLQYVVVSNCSVRSTLDNDIHDSRCHIHSAYNMRVHIIYTAPGLRLEKKIAQVITLTLRLRFAARVKVNLMHATNLSIKEGSRKSDKGSII